LTDTSARATAELFGLEYPNLRPRSLSVLGKFMLQFRYNMNNFGQGSEREIKPAGFFVIRSPLLPWDELENWGEGLEAAGAEASHLAEALRRDFARLREGLRIAMLRPEVREALFVSSSDLEAELKGGSRTRTPNAAAGWNWLWRVITSACAGAPRLWDVCWLSLGPYPADGRGRCPE